MSRIQGLMSTNGSKKDHDRNHGNGPTGELHRNTEDSAQVIHVKEQQEGACQGGLIYIPGMQVVAALRCSCNKKEHAVVDTPGMQVVAALRCSCNKKEHAVVDTPGIQVVAALRSSCSEKQKGHAVVETDHTKADTSSMQIRAGVGDPTQSKGPDVEEDPSGDSDDEWLQTAIATAEPTALPTGEPGEGQALPLPTDDGDITLQARQSHGHAKGTDEGRPVQRPPTEGPAARTKGHRNLLDVSQLRNHEFRR
jgi:hypothetical protein